MVPKYEMVGNYTLTTMEILLANVKMVVNTRAVVVQIKQITTTHYSIVIKITTKVCGRYYF
jgi:hypothetical protein